ncbi:MAG: D-arabinono-1,4-lactone oxidase [Ornithinibacter sp.]
MNTTGQHGIGTNWAGNYSYRAARLVRPRSVDELCEVVAASTAVRALGSRHSFSDLTDTAGTLVDLAGLPADVRVDADDTGAAAVVSVGGGTRYAELATALHERGWALAAMASLPHISVAGAVATGTHGSGDRVQSLAAAVRALEVIGPDGAVRRVERGSADFDGSVVALGALGIVSRLELDAEPAYEVSQEVRTGLTWSALESRFDDVTSAAYSVSVFTRSWDLPDQLWLKHRVGLERAVDPFGTVAASGPLHMLSGGSEQAITAQGGVAGPWLHRLPHFRQEFTPSNGEELQSEYFVPREAALEAVRLLRRLAPSFGGLLLVSELRTIAADELWLSGAQGRDTVALHFTWVRDEVAVRRAVRTIEEALLPLGARPHWGKVFEMDARSLAQVFPRLADFRALRDRLDPQHVFGNAFVDRVLGAG